MKYDQNCWQKRNPTQPFVFPILIVSKRKRQAHLHMVTNRGSKTFSSTVGDRLIPLFYGCVISGANDGSSNQFLQPCSGLLRDNAI